MQVTNLCIGKKTFIYTNLTMVMAKIRRIESARVMFNSRKKV